MTVITRKTKSLNTRKIILRKFVNSITGKRAVVINNKIGPVNYLAFSKHDG